MVFRLMRCLAAGVLVTACSGDASGPIDAPAEDAGLDAIDALGASVDAAIDASIDAGPMSLPCPSDWPSAWPPADPAPPPVLAHDLSVFPAVVDFGAGRGDPRTAYVINSGTGPIGPVWIDDGSGWGFDVGGNQGLTLQPGESVPVLIYRGRVDHGYVRAHAPGQAPVEIELRSAIAPAAVPLGLELTVPDSFVYRPAPNARAVYVPVGMTATVTVTNPLAIAVAIDAIEIGSPWSIVGTTCPTSLAAGATCAIDVRPATAAGGSLVVRTTPSTFTGGLGLTAAFFAARTFTLTGPGRVRSYDRRIDCPGQCAASYPRSLCNEPLVIEAIGHRPTVTWSCGTAQTVTVAFVADPDITWIAHPGPIRGVAMGAGGQVAVVGQGEWDRYVDSALPLQEPSTWLRVLANGVEIARRDYPDAEIGAVAAGVTGFAVAGTTDGTLWVEWLDGSGALRWHRDLDGLGEQPVIAIGPGGHVYVVSHGRDKPHRHLHALAPDGAPLWTREVGTGDLIADGFGVGIVQAAIVAASDVRRWAPTGGAYPTVSLPQLPDCATLESANPFANALGDGRLLLWSEDFAEQCLTMRAHQLDGSADALAATQTLHPSYGVRVATQCGVTAVLDRTSVRFFDAALQPIGQRPFDLPPAGMPSVFALGTGYVVGASGGRLSVVPR